MRPQTIALRERIVELYRQGLAPKQIAYEVGRAPLRVRELLHSAGIVLRRGPPPILTDEQIAAELATGLSLNKIEMVYGYSHGALYLRKARKSLRTTVNDQHPT
jgi:hypothetical protein